MYHDDEDGIEMLDFQDNVFRTPFSAPSAYGEDILLSRRRLLTGASILLACTILLVWSNTSTGNQDSGAVGDASLNRPTAAPTRVHKYPGDYRKHKKSSLVPTSSPTPEASFLPQNDSDCIQTRDRLLSAVDAYLFLKSNNQDENKKKNKNMISISDWCVDCHRVRDLSRIFDYNRNPLAGIFNEPLQDWNVTGATSLAQLFQGARLFNQPLDRWDTHHVKTLRGTFFGARSFDQPLASWDTSNCLSFASAFRAANAFNQDLASWNVSKIVNITHMFDGAKEFRQDLCAWEEPLSKKTNEGLRVTAAFEGTQCPSTFAPLIQWDGDDPLTGRSMDPSGPFCFYCGS